MELNNAIRRKGMFVVLMDAECILAHHNLIRRRGRIDCLASMDRGAVHLYGVRTHSRSSMEGEGIDLKPLIQVIRRLTLEIHFGEPTNEGKLGLGNVLVVHRDWKILGTLAALFVRSSGVGLCRGCRGHPWGRPVRTIWVDCGMFMGGQWQRIRNVPDAYVGAVT
ncbi:hypothetical protein Salat_1540700 [Sesamum alatum]|uniref:Uncharacterized protein n=1 Tax=Sesamum alatum TaxID=300844 RepID=A0AAE1YCQ0_9LAMI|nr:hypothetical protein Salat_1540700 [Sesamum alatum]